MADPVPIEVTRGDSSNVNFVPGVPIQVKFQAAADLPATPDGQRPVGFIRARERASNDEALLVRLELMKD